jgi:hypothetical protein
MVSVGWLEIDESGVTFPNFDRHNGESAKARGLAAERKRNQRSRVTEEDGQMSRSERDTSVTREEKRREDIKAETQRATRLPADWHPTGEDIEFCESERPDLDVQSVAEQFRDYWIAQGGAKGRKVDWPATWRNWVRNQRRGQQNGQQGNTGGLVL